MKSYLLIEVDDADEPFDTDHDKLREAILMDGPGSVEMIEHPYVVLTGNVLEGFSVNGPFGSGEEADIWAEEYDRRQRDVGNGNFATAARVHDVLRDGEVKPPSYLKTQVFEGELHYGQAAEGQWVVWHSPTTDTFAIFSGDGAMHGAAEYAHEVGRALGLPVRKDKGGDQ